MVKEINYNDPEVINTLKVIKVYEGEKDFIEDLKVVKPYWSVVIDDKKEN